MSIQTFSNGLASGSGNLLEMLRRMQQLKRVTHGAVSRGEWGIWIDSHSPVYDLIDSI